MSQVDSKNQLFDPSSAPKHVRDSYYAADNRLSFKEIIQFAVDQGGVDWAAQTNSRPADSKYSLIYYACKVGAIDMVDRILPHLSKAEVGTRT
jgi:hypothetical protein